jgi:tetraacyldisaccharide 4'-kinase
MRPHEPLLLPLSWMYKAATAMRNHLFDIGAKKSSSFEVPLIVIGNLSVGGTGKTPMVEWLISHLRETHNLAMLSRGYKRKTSGFFLANEDTLVDQVGDEPFQVYKKFYPALTVAVGEERVLAIPMILAIHPETEAILLDDAFQHRYVRGDLNILLTTYSRPFFSDHLLPFGRLREGRSGANRAHIIIVTKCPPNLSENEKKEFRHQIRKYCLADTPIFFAGVKEGTPQPLFQDAQKPLEKRNVLVLSGLANNDNLIHSVAKEHRVVECISYPDHYRYRTEDMATIRNKFREYADKDPIVITTEKDAVKLKQKEFLPYLKEIPIFALPIRMSFKEADALEILMMVRQSIERKNKKREF